MIRLRALALGWAALGAFGGVANAEELRPVAPQPAGGAISPAGAKPTKVVEAKDTEAIRMVAGEGKEIRFYRTSFVTPTELVKTVALFLDLPGVTLRDFPRQNQVLLEGKAEDIDMAIDVFAYFDVPEPQVYVEAKIIEINYESNFEFGLASFLDRNQGGPNTFWRGETVTLNPPSVFQAQQPGSLPFQGVDLAFGLVGKMAEKYGALELTLQAMQRNGTAEVLSKPSVIATQGQPASVRTAQKTPVLNIKDASTTGTDPTNLLEVIAVQGSYVETKIELAVLPKFIGEGFVTLDLRPTVSGVTGFSTGPGGTSAPIISSREAATVVTLADGETLIIGGLYTTSTVSDKAKIPLLSEIPGLGKLFERTKNQRVKTELVFFVTPHILRKRTDFKIIVPPGEAERLGEPCAPGATPAGARPAK